jgi:hypothetical protein
VKIKRKKPKMPKFLGMAWYRPWQWDRLREIVTAPDELAATYPEWLAMAEKSIQLLRRRGVNPIKVDIDAEELLAWCQERDLPVTHDARYSFVVEKFENIQSLKE